MPVLAKKTKKKKKDASISSDSDSSSSSEEDESEDESGPVREQMLIPLMFASHRQFFPHRKRRASSEIKEIEEKRIRR